VSLGDQVSLTTNIQHAYANTLQVLLSFSAWYMHPAHLAHGAGLHVQIAQDGIQRIAAYAQAYIPSSFMHGTEGAAVPVGL
jgi:hypothetical protein